LKNGAQKSRDRREKLRKATGGEDSRRKVAESGRISPNYKKGKIEKVKEKAKWEKPLPLGYLTGWTRRAKKEELKFLSKTRNAQTKKGQKERRKKTSRRGDISEKERRGSTKATTNFAQRRKNVPIRGNAREGGKRFYRGRRRIYKKSRRSQQLVRLEYLAQGEKRKPKSQQLRSGETCLRGGGKTWGERREKPGLKIGRMGSQKKKKPRQNW